MSESYYDRLGVSPDASTAEIEKAYRERLKETHPDVSDDADASDRTKALIEARDVLTDEDERARYDKLGHERYLARQNGIEPSAPQEPDDTDQSTSDSHVSTSDSRSGTRKSTHYSRGHRDWDVNQSSTGKARRDWHQESDSQRTTRDTWSTSGAGTESDRNATETRSNWRAWDTDAPFSLRDEGLQRSRLYPSSQTVVLLSSTFILYPMLLWGALLPAFPLVVNVVLAGCLLAVVAFLQSIPEVGIVVFGLWSVLLPPILTTLGLDPFVFPTVLALVATVFPLGLSILTKAVVRS